MKLRNKKTGEIIEYNEEVIYYRKLTPNGHEDWTPYHPEDWEDYMPKEPLIKDEKFRKLLLGWAKLTQTTNIFISKRRTREGKIFTEFFSQEKLITLEFLGSFDELDGMTEYTIAELCGEEEE